MNIKVFPSKISGTVSAPPSKSVTHRAIIIAALANGQSQIKNCLLSNDTIATLQALRFLGVNIQEQKNTLIIYGSKGKLQSPKTPIYLGNSGSSMRMLAAVATLAEGTITLTGERRLCERPVGDLLESLQSLGITIRSVNRNACPPIIIQGSNLEGGKVYAKGNVSSQYITALLLIAPFAKKTLTIVADGILRSKPYIALTIDIMKTFGVYVQNDNFEKFVIEKGQQYKSKIYAIEGDYSSASYFFAAAAITKGHVRIKNLNLNSAQGDRHFIDILNQMGSDVSTKNDTITVDNKQKLSPIRIDMGDYPDIVQTLAITAAFAKGETYINNINHLRHKESDRISTTVANLAKMGIKASYDNNSLIIQGGSPNGTHINTYNDHRVAMSFAVAALGARGETVIQNAEVVKKSYPTFFEDLQKIGAHMEVLA